MPVGGAFPPFVCMVIDYETAEDQQNSLQAGTDGRVLEYTSSTNSASAFGASQSQMGGRTADTEL